MAQRTVVLLEDDIEGGDASETIPFGLDGTTYEIDLNDKNAKKLRQALELYVSHARRVSKGKARKSASTPSAPPAASSNGSTNGTKKAIRDHSPREIRDWARSNGIDVPDRGRVPESVTLAFNSAQGNGTSQEA